MVKTQKLGTFKHLDPDPDLAGSATLILIWRRFYPPRIASEVSQWLSKLFHFPGGLAHCHDGIREGLLRTVQMVLHHSYPDLQVSTCSSTILTSILSYGLYLVTLAALKIFKYLVASATF